MAFVITSDVPIKSRRLPGNILRKLYKSKEFAIAVANECRPDFGKQEVRVVDTESNEVVWRSTDKKR